MMQETVTSAKNLYDRLKEIENSYKVYAGGKVTKEAVHADADGAVVLGRDARDVADFLLPGLLTFVVIEMPGVVADLVDMRRDRLGEAVVFLEVDREVGGGLAADLSHAHQPTLLSA